MLVSRHVWLVYMYSYMYFCVSLCVCLYVWRQAWVWLSICFLQTYIYEGMYVGWLMSLYVCMYVWSQTCVSMYACIYVNIYACRQKCLNLCACTYVCIYIGIYVGSQDESVYYMYVLPRSEMAVQWLRYSPEMGDLSHFTFLWHRKSGVPNEIWTHITGFRVVSVNHYTMEPSHHFWLHMAVLVRLR